MAAINSILASNLKREKWIGASISLTSLAVILRKQNWLSQSDRVTLLGLQLAELIDPKERLFSARLQGFAVLAILGRWHDAQIMWSLLDLMGRSWSRAVYRPGDAEWHYASARFYQGNLHESHLAHAPELAEKGSNPVVVRAIHKLRGCWLLEKGEFALAAQSLDHAVQLTRAARRYEPEAEAYLKLTQFHSGDLDNPRQAEQLENARKVDDIGLAELWQAIGNREKAKAWALKAYRLAWADGEPFVHRYSLNQIPRLAGDARRRDPRSAHGQIRKIPLRG